MTRHHPFLFAAVLALLCFATPVSADIGDSEVIEIHDVEREDYPRLRRLGDFWGVDRRRGTVILYVTPRGRAAVEALGYRVESDIRRTELLQRFATADREAWRAADKSGIPDFPCYRTVDETHTDLAALADANPELARWETIGQSWLAEQGNPDGDDIHVLIIANQNVDHDQAPLVIMAAQHARELTTAEAATRFAEWLLTGYDDDPTARWLVDHREVHIIAQQNPDGRRAVEDGQSMWRKNSNLEACPGGTPGVDLNRNSNYFWGDASSGDTCSQIYRGTDPASEPETQAVQDYLETVFDRNWPGQASARPWRGSDPVPADAEGIFLSLHSFSELILFPWEGAGSGVENNAPNHDQLAWLGRKLGFFTGYEVGRDILYSAGGTMTDYAHGEFGVAAFTYEIGTAFQEDCGTWETTIAEDIHESLVYTAKAAERPYQAPSGPDVIDAIGVVNTQDDTLRVIGMLDDTRFDRGGSPEGPSQNPTEDVVAVRVSLDAPPGQAGSWYTIEPEEEAPITGFDASIELTDPVSLPRLVFFQAVDSAGNLGVPEAAWLTEQLAALSPASLQATLPTGQTGQETITVSNVGSESFDWSAATDLPANARDDHDPLLDETLSLADFSLPGSGSASQTVPAGIDSNGQVVGFSFEGTVSDLGGGAWASDASMTLTAPDSSSYSVGGYQTSYPDWAFQGDGSGNPGTYASTHIGPDIFGAEGVEDEGDWQFGFVDEWQGGMDWSEVTVTLHKQEPPSCVDPSGVSWLSLDQSSGTLVPGEQMEIAVTFDTGDLDEGEHAALLCVTTNDPSAELIEVPVTLQVISGEVQIFRDRFEGIDAAD